MTIVFMWALSVALLLCALYAPDSECPVLAGPMAAASFVCAISAMFA